MADGERKERTELANDRTMLASERTLAAWWRTALTAIAIAVGAAELFGDVRPIWLVRVAATLPLLLALIVLFVGARRYAATAIRIESEFVDRVPRVELWIGTGLLCAMVGAAGAMIWLVR